MLCGIGMLKAGHINTSWHRQLVLATILDLLGAFLVLVVKCPRGINLGE